MIDGNDTRMHRAPAVSLALASVVCAVACDSVETTPPTVVRDSAGVQIVESFRPVWQSDEVWSLGAAPIADVGGGVADDDQLFRVQGAVLLDGKTIVVANAGSSELRYYTSSGQYVGTGGREGGGPGEFAAGAGPWRVWRHPVDSVAAWDISHRRISFFDSEGAYGRSVSLQPPSGAFPDVIGLLSQGRMVTRDGSSIAQDLPVGTAFRTEFEYDIYGPSGQWLADVAELPGTERFVYEWTGRKISGIAPFARSARTAVRHDDFYHSASVGFEILQLDLGTDSTMIMRALIDPTPVTQTDISNYHAERMANAPDDPTGRQAWQDWLEEIPYPDVFPTFDGLLVDQVGNLWAERYNVPADSVPKWMVFDPNGHWLGTVTLPRDFVAHDIGDNYVLGVWRDPDEIEHVQLYELVKPIA